MGMLLVFFPFTVFSFFFPFSNPSFTYSDQLWTNDGEYKPAATGEKYPSDLDDYPESGDGWMNEEGVRIDLNHRLIPKPPLRSALKQSNLRG